MGLKNNGIADDSADIYLWEMEESIDQLQSMYLEKFNVGNLPDEFLQIKLENRRKHWIIVRLILATVLGKSVSIEYDEFGAPNIPNRALNISISHSTKMLCVIISKFQLVGIDIQETTFKLRTIASKFLNAQESQIYQDTKSDDFLHACWTAKEAVFKAFKSNLPFKNIQLLTAFPFKSGLLEFQVSRDHKKFVLPVRQFKIDNFFLSYVKL